MVINRPLLIQNASSAKRLAGSAPGLTTLGLCALHLVDAAVRMHLVGL